MPMVNGREELERLRAEALKANRRVSSKITRLRREQNIKETGGIDPRLPADRIKRMNRIQLRAYLRRTSEFTSRRTQFVADSRGNPVDRRVYDTYKLAERRANQRRKEFAESIGGHMGPSGHETVGEFLERFGANVNKRYMPTDSVTQPIDRKPSHFTSADNMRKLTEALLNESAATARGERTKRWKGEAREMLEHLGDRDLVKKFDGLSDAGFEAMWSGTSFAHSLKLLYEIQRMSYQNEPMEADQLEIVKEFLDWANKIG